MLIVIGWRSGPANYRMPRKWQCVPWSTD